MSAVTGCVLLAYTSGIISSVLLTPAVGALTFAATLGVCLRGKGFDFNQEELLILAETAIINPIDVVVGALTDVVRSGVTQTKRAGCRFLNIFRKRNRSCDQVGDCGFGNFITALNLFLNNGCFNCNASASAAVQEAARPDAPASRSASRRSSAAPPPAASTQLTGLRR